MLYVLLLLSLILCCVAATQHAGFAQPAPPIVAATAPTTPPLPSNPVDTFRKLLGMSASEREKFLATLPLEKRQVVILKLNEYQKLTAEEREARLRALQVRVCVRQMIRVPASNRVERLARLVPAERDLVQARLAEWDQLAPDLQKEVLASEVAILHIARTPDGVLHRFMPPLPIVTKIEKQVTAWRSLSDGRRTEILDQFHRFFEDVTPKDRAKILSERTNMVYAKTFEGLAKEQRERYIVNFKKFAALSPAERQRFINNVNYWQTMSPEARDAWRVLAKKLSTPTVPPPLPPARPSAAVPAPADQRAALEVAADPSGR